MIEHTPPFVARVLFLIPCLIGGAFGCYSSPLAALLGRFGSVWELSQNSQTLLNFSKFLSLPSLPLRHSERSSLCHSERDSGGIYLIPNQGRRTAEDPSSLRSLGMTMSKEQRGKRKEERGKRKEERGKSSLRSRVKEQTSHNSQNSHYSYRSFRSFGLFHYLYLRSAESSDPLRSV